ncbi:MAG TPA: hypothetical protein HPP90_13185 [Deltaproteobacteria bacterium]|nr:hypothetical protein [Deltaproteobacteria bacterium]
MEELTKSQKSRIAIRLFKTTADALALRGFYKPSGTSGQTLFEALKMLSPEIYGTMNHPSIIELKGLEYVIERLPRGIEECTQIILTAQEDLENTSFEKIIPPKRRRTSYRVSEREIAFVITRGLSEIYDILTHLTFLEIEARKLRNQIQDHRGELTREWRQLETIVQSGKSLSGPELDRALWDLSVILGGTFQETRATWEYLEKPSETGERNSGLFRFIYNLGRRMLEESVSRDNELMIRFTPSLKEMIGRHKYGEKWARTIHTKLRDLGLADRPIHVISANLHSVVNLLYGYGALCGNGTVDENKDLLSLILQIRNRSDRVLAYGRDHGLHEIPDVAGTHIECQVIDTGRLSEIPLHPELAVSPPADPEKSPVILVMDYAFGTQAFEVMDELLAPFTMDAKTVPHDFRSISIMGKAGILPGKKGDIMLATAHVLEGTPHNYIVKNDLTMEDFDQSVSVYTGPMVTVLGTSLQSRDLLIRFQTSSWKAVGLEMEGGHYQRAISAAIIRGHISPEIKVRYAYYASDNPLLSGQTLASGPMGNEGIRPTYLITQVIIEKILNENS